MRNLIITAATAVVLALSVAPSFAGSSSIEEQSANIQAGGGAYPDGVAQYLVHKR
jgi:hypothetical protein